MNLSTFTAGYKSFRNWHWRGFGYRHDSIAHDYMERHILYTPVGCLRLHNIKRSDSDRHHHDHPFHFVSLILSGGYIEHQPGQPQEVRLPGTFVFHHATDLHYLKLIGNRRAWTLVLASNALRRWGFSTEDGWIDARDYDSWLQRKEEVRA